MSNQLTFKLSMLEVMKSFIEDYEQHPEKYKFIGMVVAQNEGNNVSKDSQFDEILNGDSIINVSMQSDTSDNEVYTKAFEKSMDTFTNHVNKKQGIKKSQLSNTYRVNEETKDKLKNMTLNEISDITTEPFSKKWMKIENEIDMMLMDRTTKYRLINYPSKLDTKYINEFMIGTLNVLMEYPESTFTRIDLLVEFENILKNTIKTSTLIVPCNWWDILKYLIKHQFVTFVFDDVSTE